MLMNTQAPRLQVLEIILNKPNARTVEIADRLDMEPERVRPLIADDIAKGSIVEETIIAPNGRPVQSFRFASAEPSAAVVNELPHDPFPARVVRALPPTERPLSRPAPLSSRPPAPVPPRAADPLALALSPSRVAPAPVEFPTPAPAHADAADVQAAAELVEIDVPVTRKEGVPLVAELPAVFAAHAKPELPAVFAATRTKPGSRVDKALECLRAADGKPVHVADLAAAMGIVTPQHPVSYLKTELAKGTIVRNGKEWTLGTAAVELPAPVVKPRAKAAAQESEPAALEFPRADPDALAAYVPGSKRCTMNCGPHADDPRSAAERALLCDECEIVVPEPDVAGACVAGLSDPCHCADCDTVAAFLAPPLAELDPINAARAEVPSIPAIKTPYVPLVAEGAPDIARNGLYENGEFRKPAEDIVVDEVSETVIIEPQPIVAAVHTIPAAVPAAVPLLAGVMSDGSMYLSVPGHTPMSLTPEQGRHLYEFMQRMGYAAWPRAA